ncbi:DUF3108 domain-containing protein [Lysobacter sp. N42]|uniref:DUF3108 domain-containing protein n=1 Tax=Lysobacter sp. N42 TaxID=2545719 RepID=UPI001053442B|nr:DUF3108 domain-containing protein [Lysobacter sp. N42]TCZ83902.1 DUF3108 domain-containing protein [Lysobacter sp. N42]
MSKSSILRGALLAATLALASAPALAVKPFSAAYQANYMGMAANGRMSVEPAGANRWKYTLQITNRMGNLVQSTVFEDVDGQLRPISATDSSSVLIKRKKTQANYDWGKGVATWSGDVKADRAGPVKLQPGDMDALLVNLAIARDVAAGKPLRYRMVDNGRARQLTYTVAGKEAITVDGRSQQATKVVGTSGDKQTTLWVVPGMPVPARIVQKDGNDVIELRIAG